MREVLFVAGEASGDLHAGHVAEALRERCPALRMQGIGGKHLERAGVTLIERAENLAVMGLVEGLRHLPRHFALLRELKKRVASGTIGLVILVDYPGFNLKVAEAAHAHGVPVLYYVTPQVWAWGASRLPRIANVVTQAACILPFEEPLLRSHGVNATFVGHPLLDRAQNLISREDARRALGIEGDKPLLVVFPGSRRSEIDRHLDLFNETAREVQRRDASVDVVIGVAPTVHIDRARTPFRLVQDASFTLLRAATTGLLKSGTGTLEAAVAGLPHVIGYRTNPITFAIAQRVVKVSHIGLVNIVAQREVAQEFVQHEFVPGKVADALMPLLVPGEARDKAIHAMADVRASLGEPGAANRVATMALELLS